MGNLSFFYKASIFICISIIVLIMIIVSGCINDQPKGIRVNYNIDIYVVDDNGDIIGQPVDIYDINSVLSIMGTGISKGSGASKTVNGSSHGGGSVWPVYPGDYMVFGASTNNSSLQLDWDKRWFRPGETGDWTMFTYDDIVRHMVDNETALLNVTIYVSNTTGMMIKK